MPVVWRADDIALKYSARVLEAQAVLGDVGGVLRGIPFEYHCNYNRIYQQAVGFGDAAVVG